MQRTKIEYLTHTWNPIAMRCTLVSAGCDHCWHLRMANRLCSVFDHFADLPHDDWYSDLEKANAYRGEEPYLNTKELSAPMRLRKPARIGVQFMGDLFHESIPFKWIAAIYGVMAATPQHQYFILTKRPERRNKFATWISCASKRKDLSTKVFAKSEARKYTTKIPIDDGRNMYDWPLPNVLEGVSVENQETADERISLLLQTPAAKRWVSYESALDEIYIRPRLSMVKGVMGIPIWDPPYVDWVVAGAETGPGARPCNPDWLRSIRDQCAAAGVPFFLKQINATGDRELDGQKHEEIP